MPTTKTNPKEEISSSLLSKHRHVKKRVEAARSHLLDLASQSRLASDRSSTVRLNLALNSSVHESVRCTLASDSFSTIRKELILSLPYNYSEKLVTILSNDPEEELRLLLARVLQRLLGADKDFIEDTFMHIYDQASTLDQNKMLGLNSLPEFLRDASLLSHEKKYIVELLKNDHLEAKYLDEILSLRIPGTEAVIAHHGNCPTDILEAYVKDKKGPILTGFYRNSNIPVSILEDAAADKALDLNLAMGLVYNVSLSQEAITSLKDNELINDVFGKTITGLEEINHYTALQ